MNQYLVRYTGERSEELVLADAYVHDLFDVVFIVNGQETRRVAVAEIANLERLADADPWMPEVPIASTTAVRESTPTSPQLPTHLGIQPFDTVSSVGRSSRSGPRYRSLPVAGHDPDTHEVDDIRE
jgi:hypothetical protein